MENPQAKNLYDAELTAAINSLIGVKSQSIKVPKNRINDYWYAHQDNDQVTCLKILAGLSGQDVFINAVSLIEIIQANTGRPSSKSIGYEYGGLEYGSDLFALFTGLQTLLTINFSVVKNKK